MDTGFRRHDEVATPTMTKHPRHNWPLLPLNSNMIELENIQKRFQVGSETLLALDQVSVQLAHNDYVSVMGPSGSGKSTLLNILGLLDKPDAGHYQLDKMELTTLDDNALAIVRQTKIGFVFQSFHLIPRLTALENVALPLMLAGVAEAERQAQAMDILERIGLANRADHRPSQLSGGQQQRVAIARATISKPRLLLADEPTGNLDQHSGIEVLQILESLHQSGICLVVVTHDAALGQRADRQWKMLDGKLYEER